MLQLHAEGGPSYMFPIDIAALIILALIGYLLFAHTTKNSMPEKTLAALKHVGGFALAWGAFGTLVGLFEAFNALEGMKEMIPFQVLCGGLKIALITVLYGFIVYLISLVSYIVLSLIRKN